MEIWIALEGEVRFEANGNRVDCRRGEVLVLPAALHSVWIHTTSPSVFLRTFPHDLEADVIAPLRALGFSEEQLRRVCFFPQPTVREGRP